MCFNKGHALRTCAGEIKFLCWYEWPAARWNKWWNIQWMWAGLCRAHECYYSSMQAHLPQGHEHMFTTLHFHTYFHIPMYRRMRQKKHLFLELDFIGSVSASFPLIIPPVFIKRKECGQSSTRWRNSNPVYVAHFHLTRCKLWFFVCFCHHSPLQL